VFGGIIAFDLPDAANVLDFYRDFTADCPDELTAFCGFVHAPDGSGHRIVALPMCHCGDLAGGEAVAKQARTAATPLVDLLGPMPYPIVNTLLDDGFPKGARNYWKSAFFKDLSDETVGILAECFRKAPSIMSGLVVEHLHGAVTRIAATIRPSRIASRLQPRARRPVAQPRRRRGRHRLGQADLRRSSAAHDRRTLRELPRH
jgi:hypothetical protein